MRNKVILFVLLNGAAGFLGSCTGDRVPEARVDTVNSNYGKLTGSSNIDTGVIVSHDYSASGGDKGLKDTSGKLGVYKAKPVTPAPAADTAKKDTSKIKAKK